MYVVGILTQAGHVRVEAHVERDVVLARLEEQGIALGAELVGLHLREDVVGGFLDVGGRHFRVEDEDVRAEDGGVRLGGRAAQGDDRNDRTQGGRGERNRHGPSCFPDHCSGSGGEIAVEGRIVRCMASVASHFVGPSLSTPSRLRDGTIARPGSCRAADSRAAGRRRPGGRTGHNCAPRPAAGSTGPCPSG